VRVLAPKGNGADLEQLSGAKGEASGSSFPVCVTIQGLSTERSHVLDRNEQLPGAVVAQPGVSEIKVLFLGSFVTEREACVRALRWKERRSA
jgi:hypothetical protein